MWWKRFLITLYIENRELKKSLLTQKMENVHLMLSFLPSHSLNHYRLAISSLVSMSSHCVDMYKSKRHRYVPQNYKCRWHNAWIYRAVAIFQAKLEHTLLAGLQKITLCELCITWEMCRDEMKRERDRSEKMYDVRAWEIKIKLLPINYSMKCGE